jgi:hypothetical protein
MLGPPSGRIGSFDWLFNVKPLTVESTLLGGNFIGSKPWTCLGLQQTNEHIIRSNPKGNSWPDSPKALATGGLALIH